MLPISTWLKKAVLGEHKNSQSGPQGTNTVPVPKARGQPLKRLGCSAG